MGNITPPTATDRYDAHLPNVRCTPPLIAMVLPPLVAMGLPLTAEAAEAAEAVVVDVVDDIVPSARPRFSVTFLLIFPLFVYIVLIG